MSVLLIGFAGTALARTDGEPTVADRPVARTTDPMERTLPLNGSYTVRELLTMLARLGVEFAILEDPRWDTTKIAFYSPEAKVRSVMHAMAIAGGGTWKKVGTVYALRMHGPSEAPEDAPIIPLISAEEIAALRVTAPARYVSKPTGSRTGRKTTPAASRGGKNPRTKRTGRTRR
ncbi:MAG: hypothetical protein SFX74_05475 [Fimbriimonadaceae bacterium]|nr:hypothetical protein [Fimbriimonadaceae bacterium]